MQTRHDGHVHIARATAATLGKQHDWQLVFQREAKHAVGLLVVAHALGARQHGGVIGHHYAGRAAHGGGAADHAVSRGVAHQVVLATALALRGHGQRAVFRKAAGVAQVGQVFAGGAHAQGVALGHGGGTTGVQGEGVTRQDVGQIGAQGC